MYVGCSDRFERWIKSLDNINLAYRSRGFLPPLDVIMVWHAYLLNPGYVDGHFLQIDVLNTIFDCRWFQEDITRLPYLRNLQCLGQLLMNVGGPFYR